MKITFWEMIFLRGDGMKWNDEKDAAQHMIFIVIIITMSSDKKTMTIHDNSGSYTYFNLYNNNI